MAWGDGPAIARAVAAGLLAAGLGACASTSATLDVSRIGEARIEGLEDQAIVLEDGQWEGEPWAPGAAARPRVGLVEEFLERGSFTAEGRDEAAVLLWQSGGGSGTRIWLAVLAAGEDRPRSVATALVGDRVQVIDIAADGPALVLDLVAHGPGDAACCPGQHERRRYRFDGAEVTEDIEDLGRATTALMAGRVWQLERFRDGYGEPVEVGITIEFDGKGRARGTSGCNEYEAVVEESDGKNLVISAGPTTMRRCPEDLVAAESEFLRLLAGVGRFGFVNGRLVLQYVVGDEAGSMSFSPAGGSASP